MIGSRRVSLSLQCRVLGNSKTRFLILIMVGLIKELEIELREVIENKKALPSALVVGHRSRTIDN